jgi:hypothetical protein
MTEVNVDTKSGILSLKYRRIILFSSNLAYLIVFSFDKTPSVEDEALPLAFED